MTTGHTSIEDTLPKDTPWKGLLSSKFLSVLRKKRLNSNEFTACIPKSNMKYKYLKLKYMNTFYVFIDWVGYTLTYYFAKSEIIRSNINTFLTYLLMAHLIERFSYKNANQ